LANELLPDIKAGN